MRVGLPRTLRQTLHWPVLAPVAGLLLLGVLALSGIELRLAGRWVGGWHMKQLTGIALGVAVALAALVVPYKVFLRHAYLLYAGNLALLVLVLVAGATRNHSSRWLNLFGFDFQPSELMKITLVVTLARFIRFRSSYKTFRGLGTPFLLTLVPMALILKQPDLGTALLFVPLLFTLLFVAGARSRHLLLIVALGCASLYPVYHYGLRPYQKDRVQGYLAQLPVARDYFSKGHRKLLERDELYQVHNSKTAIGEGGITGVGVGAGQDHALYWVPEHHTDFIFAAVGNELGFLGSLATILLFAWLALSILGVATRQRDPAGRLICVGVFALFASQALINMSMTIGVLPVTGMTLPFVSYGRSSLLVSILAVALVCNVAGRPSFEFGRGDFD